METLQQTASVTVPDIAEALKRVGVQPGDVVLYHGSMKSIGHVEGGPSSIADGILQSAPYVTAAIPTLWYHGKLEGVCEEKFDIRNSPAWNGLMAETMRQDPRAIRSNHWTHAVSAIGPRAMELTADHGKGQTFPSPWSETAFAEISPWTHLYEWNALYVFFGVSMASCTMRHWIEARALVEFLSQFPQERRQELREQLAYERNTALRFGFSSDRFQTSLDHAGLICRTKLGNAEVMAIRTRPMVDETMKYLHDEPEKFYPQPFLEWKNNIKNLYKSY